MGCAHCGGPIGNKKQKTNKRSRFCSNKCSKAYWHEKHFMNYKRKYDPVRYEQIKNGDIPSSKQKAMIARYKELYGTACESE